MANGRLSRAPAQVQKRINEITDKEQREILSPGMEARARVLNVRPKDLLDADAGSFVGRLRLSGEITLTQCDAAKEYLRLYADMQMAVGGPKPSGAVDLNATKGLPGPENVARSAKAMADWKAATEVLQERQNELRGGGSIIAALYYCVLLDGEHHHMIGWLREGLNALARHFKLVDKQKAA